MSETVTATKALSAKVETKIQPCPGPSFVNLYNITVNMEIKLLGDPLIEV